MTDRELQQIVHDTRRESELRELHRLLQKYPQSAAVPGPTLDAWRSLRDTVIREHQQLQQIAEELGLLLPEEGEHTAFSIIAALRTRVDLLERMLKHEGMEHSECQEQVLDLQRRIQYLHERETNHGD